MRKLQAQGGGVRASKALSRTRVEPHLDAAGVKLSEVPQSSCEREETRKVVACIGFKEREMTHRRRPCRRSDRTLWTRMVGVGSGSARQSVRDSVA